MDKLNTSTANGALSTPQLDLLISDDLKDALLPILRLIVVVISIVGFVCNLFNITIFYKLGLNTTTNICFFSLAVADTISVAWIFLLCIEPFIDDSYQIISLESMVAIILSQLFYGASAFGSWVTTIINMERCCCIVMPLKVKQIFTQKIVLSLLVFMILYEIATSAPYYTSFTLVLTIRPDTNRTILLMNRSAQKRELAILVKFMTFTVPTFTCFVLVVLGTMFLIRSFRKSIKQREKLTGSVKTEKSSVKDDRVVKMVIFICVIYILGFAINVFKFLISMVYSKLHVYDPYLGNFTMILTTFGFLLQAISCTLNIVVYLKMNSSYRNMFANTFTNRIFKK